ncbi:MAG: DUF4150 domain-containing protein [Proteobacteria bacterium]|nr:DUF4150 domain-containing protein [Pseudomonadota bacterium]
MPVTVSVDGLSVVTTKSEGTGNCTIPDICKIPVPMAGPVPIPFMNTALSEKVTLGSILTKIDGGSVALLGSYCEESSGDEGGVLGGIVSGGTKGKAMFLKNSPTVKIEGRPVCRKSDLLLMNDFNTIGMSGMDQADVDTEESIEMEEKSLEIKLQDAEGKAIPDEPYVVKHSGKIVAEGNLDSDGCATIEGIKAPGCKIFFPNQEKIREQTGPG